MIIGIHSVHSTQMRTREGPQSHSAPRLGLKSGHNRHEAKADLCELENRDTVREGFLFFFFSNLLHNYELTFHRQMTVEHEMSTLAVIQDSVGSGKSQFANGHGKDGRQLQAQ